MLDEWEFRWILNSLETSLTFCLKKANFVLKKNACGDLRFTKTIGQLAALAHVKKELVRYDLEYYWHKLSKTKVSFSCMVFKNEWKSVNILPYLQRWNKKLLGIIHLVRMQNFSKNQQFLPPDAYTYVQILHLMQRFEDQVILMLMLVESRYQLRVFVNKNNLVTYNYHLVVHLWVVTNVTKKRLVTDWPDLKMT